MGRVLVRPRPPMVVAAQPASIAWAARDAAAEQVAIGQKAPVTLTAKAATVEAAVAGQRASVAMAARDAVIEAGIASSRASFAWTARDASWEHVVAGQKANLTLTARDASIDRTLQMILGERLVRYWSNSYSSGVWEDEVAGVDAEQETASSRPTATTTPAGKTAVSFDGTNDSLTIIEGAAFSGSPDRALIFGIFKVNNASITNRTLARLRSSTNEGARIWVESNSKVAITARGGGSTGLVTAVANGAVDTDWHTLIARFDADRTVTLYLDGVAQTTTGTVGGSSNIMTTFVSNLATTSAFNRSAFGVDPVDGGFYPGVLAHWGVAVDSSANFSTQDVADLHGVLAAMIGE